MLIIICGMPRSGSTLQSNIVKLLLERNRAGERVEWSKNWQDDVSTLKEQMSESRCYCYKTHLLSPEMLSLSVRNPEKIHILLSYRDVRDVAVSMMVKFDYSFEKAKARIARAIENIERIENSEARSMTQSYGKLRYGLKEAIAEIAAFTELDCDEQMCADIYEELNIDSAYVRSRKKRIPFEKLRRNIAFLFGRSVRYADEEYMLHPNHVSETKGEAGIWKAKLSPLQIEELESIFEQRYLEN